MEVQSCIELFSPGTICDVLTHSCTTFSDINVNLYITRNRSLYTSKQQEKGTTEVMSLPLPKRNCQSIQCKSRTYSTKLTSISFSLKKSHELPSFVNADRQLGFNRSNGFIVAHSATAFLHYKCYLSAFFFAQNLDKLYLQDDLRPSPKMF